MMNTRGNNPLSAAAQTAARSLASLMAMVLIAGLGIAWQGLWGENTPASAATAQCQVKTIWGVDGAGVAREYYAGAGEPNEGTPTGKTLNMVIGTRTYSSDIAISPDGSLMWGITRDGWLAAVSTVDGSLVRSIAVSSGAKWKLNEPPVANSLSFTSDGTLLIGGTTRYTTSGANERSVYFLSPSQLASDGTKTASVFADIADTSINPGGWAGDFVTLPDGSILGVANDGSSTASPLPPSNLVLIRNGAAQRVGYPVDSTGARFTAFGATFASGHLYLASQDGRWYRMNSIPDATTGPNEPLSSVIVGTSAGRFDGATGRQESYAACSSPKIDLIKTPGTITGPDASGVYTATYSVTVTNTGDADGSYGPATDTPRYDPNLTVTGASWTGHTSGSATGAGPYQLTSSLTNIQAGESHTWSMAITFTNPNSTTPTTCTGPGTGSYNAFELAPGDETDTTNNSACMPVPSPKPQPPVIELSKSGSLPSTTGSKVGDKVTYTFEVKNTGTTDVTGLTLTDSKLSLDKAPIDGTTCSPVTPSGWTTSSVLKPTETVTCVATATYALTQADIDAGKVDNTATVNGTSDGGPATATNSAQVTPVGVKALELDKTNSGNTDVNNNGVLDAGDTLEYTFLLKNTGTVSLKNLTLTDSKLALTDAPVNATTCSTLTPSTFDPAVGLAPGESVTCVAKATYTVTADDVTNGQHVLNVASAAGATLDGTDVPSNQDTVDVPLATPANVTLTKTAGSVSALDPATGTYTVDYTVTLRNTGQTPADYTAIDTPQFASGLEIRGAEWSGATAGNAADGGPYTLGSGSIAGNSTLTWNVKVTFAYATGAAQAADCQAGTPGTGLYNAVSAASLDANACVNPPAPPKAALSVDKTASTIADTNGSGRQDAGDTITYAFVVTNTGTVTLTDVKVNDSKVGDVVCPSDPLAPAASMTCTSKDYVLTQSDVDGGNVHNDVTANATPPAGVQPPQEATDAEDTPVTPHDAMTLTKTLTATEDTNGSGKVDAGDTLVYSFTIQNTGSSTLSTLRITDTKLGLDLSLPGTLAPGASTTVSTDGAGGRFTHTLTQADIDAGSWTNKADATATGPGPEDPKGSDDEVATFDNGPSSISLTKDALPVGAEKTVTDANGNNRQDAGDTITYRFTITNTSTVTLSNVTLTDAMLGQDKATCGSSTLAPGASTTCDIAYTLTQADVDARIVHNDARTDATDPQGAAVSATASENVPVAPTTAIDLVKEGSTPADTNGNGVTDAGDTITYTFTITNTGAVTLTDVTLTDPKLGVDEIVAASLAPGANVTVTKTYTMTQADIDTVDHVVRNTAQTTGTPPAGMTKPTDEAKADVPFTATNAVQLDKKVASISDTNGNGSTDAGDTVNYTFTVTNTGKTTLTSLDLTDTTIGVTLSASGLSLAPGDTYTFTEPATHTLTQADIDAGSFLNNASVVARGPAGEANDDSSATATYTVDPAALTLTKSAGSIVDANGDSKDSAGDTVAYTFTIKNVSTVTIDAVSLSDDRLGLDRVSLSSTTCSTLTLNGTDAAAVSSLKPGDEAVCTAVALYTLTDADMASGLVQNTATAYGVDPKSNEVSATDTADVKPTRTPGISLVKQGTAPVGGIVKAGDVVTYTFTVTNTGNVVLAPVTLTDAKLGLKDVQVTDSLAAGAKTTHTATYTVTQADVDAGTVDNFATATGTPPGGLTPPEGSDDDTQPITRNPGIAVTKSASVVDSVNANGSVDLGESVRYTFEVRNTGNVTLTGVTVNDAMLAAANVSISCPSTTLAGAASMLCTADYTPDQATIDAAAKGSGLIANVATATGVDPTDKPVESPQSNADVPVTVSTSLTIDKIANPADPNGNGLNEEGEKIAYSFVVTNTSTVTVTDVAVNDAMLAGAQVDITCPSGPVAPGAKVTCTAADYTITAKDAAAGTVDNTATASATDPKGAGVASPEDSTSTPVDAKSGLSLVKEASLSDNDDDGKADAGETVLYSFTVTNTGNVSLSDLTLTDAKLGLDAAPMSEVCQSDPGTLAPGASAVCVLKTAYTVTQSDVDASQPLVNVATATAKDPSGGDVPSNESQTETPVDAVASLKLEKMAALDDTDGDNVASVGETVRYTFKITNTGAVTVKNLSVEDPKLAAAQVTISCSDDQLAPGAETVCVSLPYTVTQADVDAEKVLNTATARGDGPQGNVDSPADDVVSNEDSAEVPVKLPSTDPVVEPTPTPSPTPTATPTPTPTPTVTPTPVPTETRGGELEGKGSRDGSLDMTARQTRQLANTGADAALMMGMGAAALMLAAGAVLLVARRRRS